MNHLANTIGLQLPSLSARHAVMNCVKEWNNLEEKLRPNNENHFSFEFSKESLGQSSTDDETASTISTECSISSSASYNVSFSPCLVTAEFERPATMPHEKQELYYCEKDYRRFRREYYEFRKRGSSLVHFCEELVTQVHQYSSEGSPSDLYYNETDLKR
jgi:hypothetical protein